jgi:hypothetical protein
VIGLYDLLGNPTTQLIEPSGPLITIDNMVYDGLNKLRPDCEQIVPDDFNISFKSNSSRICKSYNKNLLDMFNLMQLIKDHTPVPPTSSTNIAHIIKTILFVWSVTHIATRNGLADNTMTTMTNHNR